MKQSPILAKSFISEKWHIVTKYKWINKSKGQFEAKEKFDITEQINHYFVERKKDDK